MTVGINTEAINHKNIPFTMYDLGWVVLCTDESPNDFGKNH